MSMDQLQVIALMLEMTGIGLTVIHIYRNDFSQKTSEWIEKSIKYIGLDQFANMTGGIDYDFEHLSKEEREQVFRTREVTILAAFIAIPFVYSNVNYGQGFLWNTVEFISAYFQAFILVIIGQYILVSLVHTILYICKKSGHGDIVIGIGLSLACFGLIIEAVQIYFSSLSWTLWIILSVLIIFILLSIIKYTLSGTDD